MNKVGKRRPLYILWHSFLTSVFCVLSAVAKYFGGIILRCLNYKAKWNVGEVLDFLRGFSRSVVSLNKHMCTTHHGVDSEQGILDLELSPSPPSVLPSTNNSLSFPLTLAPFPACQQFSGIHSPLKECKRVAVTCVFSGIFAVVLSTSKMYI